MKIQHGVILSVLVIGVLAAALVSIFLGPSPQYGTEIRYVYAAIILVAGILISRAAASLIKESFQERLGRNALVVENVIALGGYVISGAAAISFSVASPTTILAGAAFGGLVLGLALQPTLGSFFAGIVVLLSGTVKPGTTVRILSGHIPFQWAFSPGYKYFSPDQIYSGYLGEVLEVGLFFTTLRTEEGQLLKVPNTILATDAALVEYNTDTFVFNVRYEFPIKYDPKVVLEKAKAVLGGYPVLHVYINEQSDKQFYIVKVVLDAKEQDHAAIKSEILTKLIALHNDMARAESFPTSSSS